MPNFIIKNLMSSQLDLSAIKDIHGQPVSLRPQNGPGARREIGESVSKHDAVTRVVDAKWASLTAVADTADAPFVPAAAPEEPKSDVVSPDATKDLALAASGMSVVAPEPTREPATEEVHDSIAASDDIVVEVALPVVEETVVEAAVEEKPAVSTDAPTLGGRPSNRRGR